MMNKKMIYFLAYGIGLVSIKFLVQILTGYFCKGGGLGCLAEIILFEMPGLLLGEIIKIDYNMSGLLNISIYFMIGGLIGLLVNKIKSKK